MCLQQAAEVSEIETMEVTAVMSMGVVTVDLLDTLLIGVGEITRLEDHLIMIAGTEEEDQGHFLLMVIEAQREHPLGVVLMAIHDRFQAWTCIILFLIMFNIKSFKRQGLMQF